jgi:putative transposase
MRKRPRPDQIASVLRDFQADLDAGLNIDQACRKAGIGPTTYYRWKALQGSRSQGGMAGIRRL